MARHKRRRPGLFVRRSAYLSLQRRYSELLAAYRALEGDHQGVLTDHEELLWAVEAPAHPEPPGGAYVPSWAVTEEIPVITEVPLDPDKATALTHRTGLLDGPSGAWGPVEQGTTG